MDKDKKLEKLMSNDKAPPPGDDLADRIIMAASHIEQRQNIWQLIGKIFEEFKLPAPTYSLASLLVVGFLAGFTIYSDSNNAYVSNETMIRQLLYENEELL